MGLSPASQLINQLIPNQCISCLTYVTSLYQSFVFVGLFRPLLPWPRAGVSSKEEKKNRLIFDSRHVTRCDHHLAGQTTRPPYKLAWKVQCLFISFRLYSSCRLPKFARTTCLATCSHRAMAKPEQIQWAATVTDGEALTELWRSINLSLMLHFV